MRRLPILLSLLLLFMPLGLWAVGTPYTFDNPAKEAQFKHLAEELRCLVCQNQNLADSNSDLAGDLRNEVYKMVEAGNSNEEVVDFMVARYGDFVRYRPPMKPSTYLLWTGPVLLLLCGALVLGIWVRGRSRSSETPLSDTDRHRLQELTQPQDKNL